MGECGSTLFSAQIEEVTREVHWIHGTYGCMYYDKSIFLSGTGAIAGLG